MESHGFTSRINSKGYHSLVPGLISFFRDGMGPFKDGTTVAVAGLTHQHIDLELGEVPDLEGFCQREGTQDFKSSEDLPGDQQICLKCLVNQ